MSVRKHPADGGVQVDIFEWTKEMPEDPPNEDRCVNYADCGNEIKQNGRMCGYCLDNIRRKDREEDEGPKY